MGVLRDDLARTGAVAARVAAAEVKAGGFVCLVPLYTGYKVAMPEGALLCSHRRAWGLEGGRVAVCP